ncbi:hypothetical protein [Actinomadura sp. HBU206391]|uniref:hypothetical protein n=1 Tax=Actinomadura sp. HBU206391 TaxID=2731692 RepID=UPI00164FBD8B|nr:hypothetical protein [Actinomadura sp. HBU206391]MBC6457353.1 hypothetical protein [Actinomadura sp. HBU206391]
MGVTIDLRDPGVTRLATRVLDRLAAHAAGRVRGVRNVRAITLSPPSPERPVVRVGLVITGDHGVHLPSLTETVSGAVRAELQRHFPGCAVAVAVDVAAPARVSHRTS